MFARRDFPLTRHGVTSALYGTRKWNLSAPPGEPAQFLGETFARDGIFTSTAKGEPIRTRVSAVAVYDRRDRGDGAEYELSVMHNPFAARPLSPDVFSDVPQFVERTAPDEETVRLAWVDDVTPTWWEL